MQCMKLEGAEEGQRGGWLMEYYDCRLLQNNIKGQEWSEVKELIKISKLEINTIIRSWTRGWKIISERAIKKPFRASIKVITIKGICIFKMPWKINNDCQSEKNDLSSPRDQSALGVKWKAGRGRKKGREWREEDKTKSRSPDPLPACAWPYAARAACGKQTCSCTGGRRSSPRSSHGGTWCAPSEMSSACSPGHSRGRSTVGRRHLAFQVAGLHRGGGGEERGRWREGGMREREGEESGPKGQRINGS